MFTGCVNDEKGPSAATVGAAAAKAPEAFSSAAVAAAQTESAEHVINS